MTPLKQDRKEDEETRRKRAAVAELYETRFERVARYIMVRIGNMDEAQDLASETFVRALRSVESYKETGAPMEAWIFKIAHNIVVDYLRKKGSRPRAVPMDETGDIAGKESPDEAAEQREEVQELRKAMEQLSDSQRQVLALRFTAELTSEEAGQVIGKKPGAVREMQSAAIKKLREVLGG